MPVSNRSKTARPRATRQRAPKPPVIEPLPFHQEAYYVGLGLVDWAAENVGRLSDKLRVIEKQLVQRGQHPNTECTRKLDAARSGLSRRGREIQSNVETRFRSIWNAVRGTPGTPQPETSTAPGAA